MVTIPGTTPVVREKVLNEYQGLRSFYSLNPWLFSLTPPAWQKWTKSFPLCKAPLLATRRGNG
jgi:hypothetical protein